LTIRDHLKSKLNKARAVAFISLLVFGISAFWGADSDLVSVLVLIPFGFAAASTIYILYGINCPRCDASMGKVLSGSGKTNFCPQCGVSFDEDLHGHENSSQPTSEQKRDAASGTDRFL